MHCIVNNTNKQPQSDGLSKLPILICAQKFIIATWWERKRNALTCVNLDIILGQNNKIYMESVNNNFKWNYSSEMKLYTIIITTRHYNHISTSLDYFFMYTWLCTKYHRLHAVILLKISTAWMCGSTMVKPSRTRTWACKD